VLQLHLAVKERAPRGAACSEETAPLLHTLVGLSGCWAISPRIFGVMSRVPSSLGAKNWYKLIVSDLWHLENQPPLFILFYFILFYFILFYFILFYFILFFQFSLVFRHACREARPLPVSAHRRKFGAAVIDKAMMSCQGGCVLEIKLLGEIAVG